ncbi:synaptic vesicle membrane protein VAT-1 homolog [Bacillus rossius redtenbacheri]|uniref:synaptic vesicle membrane protein VAT-1 homolog n=1 Tax=Bacillus rossius redtenbacheri TaxID=93214 RepID=UPI002FDC9334
MDSEINPPREVKSVVLGGYGSYNKIKVQPWPLPAGPGEDEVELQVVACGLNFADVYTRQGLLRDRSPPFVMGMECAGKVTVVGSRVTNIQVGDRVLCYQHTGGLHREIVIVPSSNCFVLPEVMSYEEGASFAANYLTAYFSVLDIGNLRPGQSVLVHSCAGGVGWAATQLALSVGPGVTVFGTASAQKHEAAHANGVTHTLLRDSYAQELRELSPDGVDVVVDSVGSSNFTVSQDLLKPLGRVVLIGSSSMITNDQKLSLWSMLKAWWTTKNVSPTDLIMKNRVAAGLHLGQLVEKDPVRVRQAVKHLFELYQQGKIRPKIDSQWPLDKVVEATKVLAERRNVGKVLLTINDEKPKPQ